MVGQTYEQTANPQVAYQQAQSSPVGQPQATAAGPAGDFESIPTRIQGVPELIVENADPKVAGEITETLGDLGQRLAKIHLTAAEAYLSQGQYAEAVPHIEAAVGMDPSDLGNQNQLGYVRYLAGDDQGAIHALEQVLAGDPTNADALFNVGMIRFGLEDLPQAEASFRACSQYDANNPEVWNNLGVALFKRGKADEARACFQRTLAIDPGNEDAQFNLQNI